MTSVSIVMPVLNEAASIEVALSRLSCAAEVIVVDGGSNDDTVEIARRTANRVVTSKPGRATQMNAGARASQGDILVFLHVDTLLPCDFVQLMNQFAESDYAWGRFDVTLDGPHPMFRVIETMMNARSRLTSVVTGDQVLFVRRETFLELNGYADIALMEDIELSKRLRNVSRPLNLDARVVTSARRWQANGIGRTILMMWKLRLLYFLGKSPDQLAQLYR